MAQDDHSVRSLAEILREHGLESEFGTRPGRRRENEPKADWPARPEPGQQPPSRLRPEPEREPERVRDHLPERSAEIGQAVAREPRREVTRAAPEDSPRLDRRVSDAGRVPPSAEGTPPASPPRFGRRSTDLDLPAGLPGSETPPSSGPSTAAIPGLRPSGKPAVPGAADPARPVGRAGRRPAAAHPLTGPIPVATSSSAGSRPAEDDGASWADEAGPTVRGGVVAWARFIGELLLAVAVGVGIYFAFTVLWELLPYVALVAAPLTVTGLVAGVAAWRHRSGQAQLGVRLLAVLLFAGTLLAIAPAAGLLAGS